MNEITKKKHKVFRIVMVFALAFSMLAMLVPAQSVSAASNEGSSVYSSMFKDLKTSFGHNKEQMDVLKHYQKNLVKKVRVLEKKGITSTSMQAVLDQFNTSYYAAQSAYVSARDLFATHPGFDAKYNVINNDLAHSSVIKARSYFSVYQTNVARCKSLMGGANAQFNRLNKGE